MIWLRGACTAIVLLSGSASAQLLPEDRHESASHRVSSDADALVIDRAVAAKLGATRGPDVAVAEAPRDAAARARRSANPLLVLPATTTLSAGYRWGKVGTGLEVTGSVVQPFSVRGLGDARANSAHALRMSVETGVTSTRLDAALRALLAWIDTLEAKSVHDLRASARADAEKLVNVAQLRVSSGVAEPLELALAHGELGAAAALELEAEGQLSIAHSTLRYATGLEPTRAVVAQGSLEAFAAMGPAAAPTGDHPEVQHARARAELAHKDADVARASTAPTFGVGASYQREGTSDQVLMGVMQIPLPFGDYGGYARARQDVEASQLARQSTRLERELAFRQEQSFHESEHARATYEVMLHGARAPFREALRLALLRYEKGPGDLATVLVARQRLTAAEERVVTAAAQVQRADIRHSANVGRLLEENR